jgi:hypothetical protein
MTILNFKKMSAFKSMGPTSLNPKKSSLSTIIDKSLSWILFWRRPKKVTRGRATGVSPERTALMSFDDLSLFNESSHCFNNSRSSDSVLTMPPNSIPTESVPTDSSKNDKSLQQSTPVRRSLLYAFHMARIKALAYPDKDDGDADSADDDESEHFSISTDLRYHQPIIHRVSVHFTTENGHSSDQPLLPAPPPSGSSSVQTSRSSPSVPSTMSANEKARMSLDQFLEERTQASSLMTGPMNLDTIRADDAASVGSASLDVMFKGDYPQLVLTPSTDGTASRMTGSSNGSKVGATAAASVHVRRVSSNAPAFVGTAAAVSSTSNRSVSSFDTAKKTVSCTPQWLNDNIDRVWRQFDQCKIDPDGRYAPDDDPYEESEVHAYEKPDVGMNVYRYQFKNGEITETGSDDDKNGEEEGDDDSIGLEATESSTEGDIDAILDTAEIHAEDYVTARDNKNDQDKLEVLSFRSFSPFDDMGWSFSAESSVKSISEMIEKEVIHPILKPICELVEATEIPESKALYIRHRRSFPSSSKLHNNASYRMSPRRPRSRVTTKI